MSHPTDSVKNHPDTEVDDDGYEWGPEDNGTMPENVEALGKVVVGRRIVSAEKHDYITYDDEGYHETGGGLVLTLDDGTRAAMINTDDCCAHTSLSKFLLHPERVDHVITGVASTGGFTKWHIFADLGDVLELDVEWSSGNPFYYGYGFQITTAVLDVKDRA